MSTRAEAVSEEGVRAQGFRAVETDTGDFYN